MRKAYSAGEKIDLSTLPAAYNWEHCKKCGGTRYCKTCRGGVKCFVCKGYGAINMGLVDAQSH